MWAEFMLQQMQLFALIGYRWQETTTALSRNINLYTNSLCNAFIFTHLVDFWDTGYILFGNCLFPALEILKELFKKSSRILVLLSEILSGEIDNYQSLQ